VLYGITGSAATIDSDGNLDMYECQTAFKFSTCKQTNPSSFNLKEKYDRIMDSSSFGSESVQAYAFTKAESLSEGKSVVCYQARIN